MSTTESPVGSEVVREKGRSSPRRVRNPMSAALFVALLLVFAAIVLPPIATLIRIAFTNAETGQIGLDNFARVLPSLLRGHLLTNTIIYTLCATGFSFVFGSALAWFAERMNAPFRRLVYVSAFMSFAFPAVIQVLGWLFVLGRNGLFDSLLVNRLHLLSQPLDVQSMAGAIFVESALWTPVVFLLMVVPFRSMDATLEEAARVAGASPVRVFFRITLRLATPAALAVLLITVVRTLESFEVPAMVGLPGGFTLLTTEIYVQLQQSVLPDFGQISAYSSVLILLVLPLLYGYYRATKGQGKYVTITGKGMKSSRADLGRYRWLVGIFMLSLPVIVFGPVLTLLWASLLPYYQAPSRQALASVSFDNYAALFAPNLQVLPTLANTAYIAVACAVLVVALTAAAAWVITRTRIRGRALLDVVSALPLVIPALVLGVGMLYAYVSSPLPIYGTAGILVLAFMARSLPYGMRFNHAGILAISEELEESALVAGSTYRVMLRRIVAPLLLPALFTAGVYVFLITARELPAALLLQSSGARMISVTIWTLWDNGALTLAAALSVIMALILTAAGLALQILTERFGISTL